MIDVNQFKKHIVVPVLSSLSSYLPGCDSYESVDLMLGTVAKESEFTFIKQKGGGPAISLYQIEPFTFKDTFVNFIQNRKELDDLISSNFLPSDLCTRSHKGVSSLINFQTFDLDVERALSSLMLATIIARIKYWRAPEPLPKRTDDDYIRKLGEYWKRYYNTREDETADRFVAAWHKCKVSKVQEI